MEALPRSMQAIRAEVRACPGEGLSFPQFRILAAIQRGQDRVSEIAKIHDVSQAAMSKMVDSLVGKGWVSREIDAADRRRIDLELTAEGRRVLERTRRAARKGILPRLAGLSERERADLSRGMELLHEVFSGGSGR